MTKGRLPASIRLFSILLLLAVGLELANNLWLLRAVGRLAGENLDMLIGAILPPSITLLLWFAVVRWWSVIAKWLLVAFIAVRLGFIALAAVQAGSAVLTKAFLAAVVAELLKAAAVALLFRADARAYLAEDVT